MTRNVKMALVRLPGQHDSDRWYCTEHEAKVLVSWLKSAGLEPTVEPYTGPAI